MDNLEIAEGYIRYSRWWIDEGCDIHEKSNARCNELIKEYQSEGLTEQEAIFKANSIT